MGWCDANGELSPMAKTMFKSVEAGAATTVWCATSPQLEGHGGVFCEDTDIAAPADGKPFVGVHAHAIDPEAATRLWALTEETLG